MQVPKDPRPQFSELAVVLANNDLGRAPWLACRRSARIDMWWRTGGRRPLIGSRL